MTYYRSEDVTRLLDVINELREVHKTWCREQKPEELSYAIGVVFGSARVLEIFSEKDKQITLPLEITE
jgi:hypothetical protein